MSNASQNLIEKFNLRDAVPPRFLRSFEEVESCAGTAYSHLMRRAWNTMGLNGILCIEEKPTVYFKEVDSIDYSKIQTLHWQFWNQGTATLLVISSPKEVQVYSGLVPPAQPEDDITSENRLVNTLTDTAEMLEFVNRVEAGEIYREKPECFDSRQIVDHHLLANLEKTRDLLCKCDEHIQKTVLHALLARVVFTCYLTARGIINKTQFERIGAHGVGDLRKLLDQYDDEKAKTLFYKLFGLLTDDFNGSMFDDNIEAEKRQIKTDHIKILRRFLKVEEMSTGQMPLPFWNYNFEIIPVETISTIYERFIKAESPQGQKSSGAFYTPRHLAEFVVDVATKGWESFLGKRYLDPAAGSGIFLVILFNRMAEEWRSKHPGESNSKRANALREILQTNLCGVDKEETACRIACFSLYLALLDQLDPRDIKDLKEKHGKVLPKLLSLKRDGYTKKEPTVIFEGNFFDPKIPLGTHFDLVIGNPPWVGRNQPSDPMVYKWCESSDNPATRKAPTQGQDRKSFLMPNNQVAHAFMWKAPLHVHPNGNVCLLLPSKVFLARTDKFQNEWFSRFTVEKILHLSDMSFLLFEHSSCPATITKYGPEAPSDMNYKLEYIIPKISMEDPRRGVISIDQKDRWHIKLTQILKYSEEESTSLFWKKYYWATPRDLRFLDKLLSLPPLSLCVGTPGNHIKWIKGQGFEPFNKENYKKDPEKYGEPKSIWWKPGHLYLDNQTIKHKTKLLVLESDCNKVSGVIEKLRRSPDKKIFTGPKVLSNSSASWIAYCDFPVLYQRSVQSISGEATDENLLMFLSAVLNSKLSKYFLFHTAANLGTERRVVHMFELLRMPFPMPEDTSDSGRSKHIVGEISRIIKNLKKEINKTSVDRQKAVESAEKVIEPLIYEYYDIHDREKVLIEDTCKIWKPSSTRTKITGLIPTLRTPEKQERKRYADLLCQVLNEWAARGKIRLRAEGIISSSSATGIITLNKGDEPAAYRESLDLEIFNNALRRINDVLPETRGYISYSRGLTIFDRNCIHIIKPLNMRHWALSAALNDADEIAAAILSSPRSK